MRDFYFAPLICLIAVLSLLSCPLAVLADDYQLGRSAANAGNFAEAYYYWKPLADKGHARALFNIGRLYARGEGLKKDFVKARGYFEAAANQGDAEAAEKLGHTYFYGDGVPKDLTLAKKWYDRALQLQAGKPKSKPLVESPRQPIQAPPRDSYDMGGSAPHGSDLSSSSSSVIRPELPSRSPQPRVGTQLLKGSAGSDDILVFSDGSGSPNASACLIAAEQILRNRSTMETIESELEKIVGHKMSVSRCRASLASYVLIEQDLMGITQLITVQHLQEKMNSGQLARVETIKLDSRR